MIKKTLYFENPAYLSLKNKQLVIRLPQVEANDSLPLTLKQEPVKTIPVEDIGVIILDHSQISITHGLLEALLANNVALITCGQNHMPLGLQLPLEGNTLLSERSRAQIEASQPLKKQLWQQTVQSKIINQAQLLKDCRKQEVGNMMAWAREVKSGDTDNLEGRAAVYYWSKLFGHIPDFQRRRDGLPPNNLLNYGYAVLRAILARALVASGLFPLLGIHHHNRYNPYCLADDVMEPYRPFVDRLVVGIVDSGVDFQELTKDIKLKLLGIPVLDVRIQGKRSPLMVAASLTTASLARCYLGEARKIVYPCFEQ